MIYTTGSDVIRYDKTIRAAVEREIKKPFKFTVDFVEHDQGYYDDKYVYYVELRVYDNEVLSFSDDQWQAALSYLLSVQNVIQLNGIRCELGGVAGDPPTKSRKGK